MCESENSLKREWFTQAYGCVWVDWTDRESFYKDEVTCMGKKVVCLQDSSEFCNRMIQVISPWSKKAWGWIIVCGCKGRGRAPCKNLRDNVIK